MRSSLLPHGLLPIRPCWLGLGSCTYSQILIVEEAENLHRLTFELEFDSVNDCSDVTYRYGLALKGQAPKVFLRTTSWGIPYVCVLLQTAFMFLAFMTLSNGALTVFWW